MIMDSVFWFAFYLSDFMIPWQRITIPEILDDEWFKKGYKPPVFEEKEDTNLDDVEAVFRDSEVSSANLQTNFLFMFRENAE